jgi:hypothetical protein
MQKAKLTPFRILSATHVIVGLLMLPLTMFLGLSLAPVLLPGPVWVVILGIRLWRPSARVGVLLRRTHYVGLPVAALLCAYGGFAIQAAERSAAAGGGLLGTYGLIPLGLGAVLGITALTSLWLARRLSPVDGPAA